MARNVKFSLFQTGFLNIPSPVHHLALITAIISSLLLSCNSTRTVDLSDTSIPDKTVKTEEISAADVKLFSRLYMALQKCPEMKTIEFKNLKADIESSSHPTCTALYETENKDGYLYISHIGSHVAIAYLDDRFGIKDLKAFPSKLGFSACWKQGLILTLHRHPDTGVFIDTKVLVQTAGSNLSLQYDVK